MQRGIFYEQNNPHPGQLGIPSHIAPIFLTFDNGHQQLGITRPHIGPIDDPGLAGRGKGRGVQRHAMGDEDHRDIRVFFLHLTGEGQHIHVRDARHGDDHVVVLFFQFLEGLFRGGDPMQLGRMTEVQTAIFVDDMFRKPPILFQNPGIIGGGHQ